MANPSNIQQLLSEYLAGDLIDEVRLAEIVADESNAEEIRAFFLKRMETEHDRPYEASRFDPLFEKVIHIDKTGPLISNQKVHFLRTAWFRYAAAIILVFGIASYIWSITSREEQLATQEQAVPSNYDLPPGDNRAILTLSDGKKIQLSDSSSQRINDGSLSIENRDGQLIYQDGERTVVNSMATPRGGQYKLKLADGSIAWLNAESKITYPTRFAGSTREVTIEGEVFFEINPDEKKPFKVRYGNSLITVLGTTFNVNHYRGDSVSKATLVEGSIKIDEVILRPGQAFRNGRVMNVDVEQDIAWTKGLFSFKGADLSEVMRVFERWYDIDVSFIGKVKTDFRFFRRAAAFAFAGPGFKNFKESQCKFYNRWKKINCYSIDIIGASNNTAPEWSRSGKC